MAKYQRVERVIFTLPNEREDSIKFYNKNITDYKIESSNSKHIVYVRKTQLEYFNYSTIQEVKQFIDDEKKNKKKLDINEPALVAHKYNCGAVDEYCPNCNTLICSSDWYIRHIRDAHSRKRCDECGQKILWSEKAFYDHSYEYEFKYFYSSTHNYIKSGVRTETLTIYENSRERADLKLKKRYPTLLEVICCNEK